MKRGRLKRKLALCMLFVMSIVAVPWGKAAGVQAAEKAHITASVEGWDGIFFESDTETGKPFGRDPKTSCVDSDGKPFLADLIDSHPHETLVWQDEDGNEFNWVETDITGDITVTGKWLPCVYKVTVSYDDGGRTKDLSVDVNPGQTFQEAYGSLETPKRSGYQFVSWQNLMTGKEFDPDEAVYQNTAVIAKWAADMQSETFAPYDPVADVPQTINGSCYIGQSWMAGAQSYFILSGFSGQLAGQTVTGQCADHTAAEPNNVSATYTGTLQSVNVSTGEVVYSVYVTPPGATTGTADGAGLLTGYQHVSAMVTLHRDFGGFIQIVKSSANLAITDGNKCYSLAGAKFSVVNAKGATVDTLVTDASGNTGKSKLLPAGKYTVVEKEAPKGYAKAADVPVTLNVGETKKVSVKDEPTNDPMAIQLAKIDRETGSTVTQGSASLEGAEFTIKYYDGYYTEDTLPGNSTRAWVIKTKELKNPSTGEVAYGCRLADDFKVSGDEFYYLDGSPEPTLPLGTISVEETKAPTGYLLENSYLQAVGSEEKITGVYVAQITQDGNLAKLKGGNEYTLMEQVARGDLEFIKAEDGSMKRMANIPFKITSKTTGESHVILTDENGAASTASGWNKHSQDTNAGKTSKDGIWFNGLNDEENGAPVNDGLGALPYDTYIIEELACEGNEGKRLLPAFEVVISRDKHTVSLGTLTNDEKTNLLISKTDATTGEQIEGAELELYKKTDGEWEKIASTVTTKEVWRFQADPGEYKLKETLAPPEYLLSEEAEFTVREGVPVQEVEMKDEPIKISGNIDKKQTLAGSGKTYSYTIDYASTSNTWADELNVTDPLECVNAGYARLDAVRTPVSYDDYDGKMNVWYQTNKNDKGDTEDAAKYNACSTNPENPRNLERERILDYTGWKLWKADVSTLKSEILYAADLDLAADEYITSVRFEHGRVEQGFATRKSGDGENVLDPEKSEQDNLEKAASHECVFNLKDAANDELKEDREIHYAPAVFEMTLLKYEEYKEGKIELWNSAKMDIYRNKGVTDNLKDADEDQVVQRDKSFTAPQTGLRSYAAPALLAGMVLLLAAIWLCIRIRRKKNTRL